MSFKSILSFFTDLFFSFFKPEAAKVFKQFVITFKDVALAEIVKEANSDVPGEVKFSNVVERLTSAIARAGWVATRSAVNTLVQDVYTAWKSSQGDILVSPPK